MSTLSLDLRGVEATHILLGETPARGASVSLLLHSLGIASLAVLPLLTATSPPDVANALAGPLVRPVLVTLPLPSRPARPAPKGSRRKPSALALAAPATPVAAPESLDLANRLDLDPPGLPADIDDGGEPRGTGLGISECPAGSLCAVSLPPVEEIARTVRIGGDIKEPKLMEARPPVYPPLALAAGVTGTVVIEAHVAENGRILETQILDGHPLFDEAALASVRSRRYRPLLLNGVPVDFLVTIRVAFNVRR